MIQAAPIDGGADRIEPCRPDCLLIVDDESVLREVFKMVILSEIPDLSIDLAQDGAEAVRSFAEAHHAVLLMDLRMPVMDGRQAFLAIEQLCLERKWEMPAVIFCSGFSPPDSVLRLVDHARRHELLSKPVSNEDLVSAVRRRLGE